MAYTAVANIAPQYEAYPNWWLKAYDQGTTAPKVMALDYLASTTVAKLELDGLGFIKTAGNARVIPYIDGAYDAWLIPTEAEANANDLTNAIQVADNIDPAKIFLSNLNVETYLQLDAIPAQTTGNVITVTADGIAGDWVVDEGAHTANVGTVRDFTNAVGSQYLRRLFSGSLNILWFGGKADSSTDNHPAWVEAAKIGKPILWPKPSVEGLEYWFQSTIDYNALDAAGYPVRDVVWWGEGDYDGVLRYKGAGDFILLGDIPSNYQPTVVMKNLAIYGDGVVGHTATTINGFPTTTSASAGSSSTQTGIVMKGSGLFHSLIQNVRFKFWNIALDQRSYVFGLNLTSCVFQSNNIGWRVDDNSTSSTAYKCEWAGHAVGVQVIGSNQNLSIMDSTFEANTAGAGILSSAGECLIVSGCYFADRFVHVGADALTPTNGAGVLNTLYWRNNFAGVIELGDNIRNVFVEKSLVTSVKNEYSFQGNGVIRRVHVDTDCFDVSTGAHFMMPLDHVNNFTGSNSLEIISGASGTSLNRNAVQVIPNATPAAVIWTTENYDDNGLHSLISNTERITVDRPAKYFIDASIGFASSPTGYRRVEIRINGDTIVSETKAAVSGVPTYTSISLTRRLYAGDYIEMWVSHTAGASLNTVSAAGDRPYLNCHLIN